MQNTFGRMVNVLSGSEIEKAAVGKLRDVAKLYNSEEEVETAEKEINGLSNQKEVAEKEDVDKIRVTQEEKERKERFEEQNKKTKERN